MMRKKWIKWTGSVLAMFVATAGLAQETDNANVEVRFRKGSQLSAEEQMAQSKNYLEKMKTIFVTVNQLAEKARDDKDIIKLNCVNDKLIQFKGHLNLAEKTIEALQYAIARRDESDRNHQFAKVTITYQNVIVISQEADACVGEDISFVGATRVDVEVDEDIPQEDPTEEPPDVEPPPAVEPPASPFR